MAKILFIGDAGVSSGYSTVTHEILRTVSLVHDVSVIGVNYLGDPRVARQWPYDIYPAYPGGDGFGVGRLAQLLPELKPDIVMVQTDPWNVPAYVKKAGSVPVVASVAVDGKNCAGRGLNSLALAIFWTQFGLDQARQGGYTGPAEVIPLGVDLQQFSPMNRVEARRALGLKPEFDHAFIVGNVSRNQPRKRLDLTIKYFAEWVRQYGIQDAYLYLHAGPTAEGWDLGQLAQYYQIQHRTFLMQPEQTYGVTKDELRTAYCAHDVHINTGLGEGWGLPAMESMACGVPQILPEWSAFNEWARPGATLVECTSTSVNHVNVEGGIADQELFIEALNQHYAAPLHREGAGARGLKLVKDNRFRWSTIGAQFTDALVRVWDRVYA